MNRLTRRALCIGAALAFFAFTPWASAGAKEPLRVCADPAYMPYSDRAGAGFENKIAEVVGRALGRPVEFYWSDSRGPDEYSEYIHDTIQAGKCDLLVDVPYGFTQLDTTNPYFISSYVFVYKKSANYNITSLDSPALRHLRIGYEAETPVESGLKLRTLTIGAKPFLTSEREDQSPADMVAAIENGTIDVGLTWDPAIGYYLKSHPDLTVVTIPNSRSQGSPEQYSFPMAMATRPSDKALHASVNRVIATHQAELDAVLHQYNIQFFKPGGGS